MEIINLPKGLKVFGFEVKSFPNGIDEAFGELINKLPKDDKRPYYGISECIDKRISYKAAALETFAGEGAKYGYETYEVESGDYLVKTVQNWRQKTKTIKDVFSEMLKDERAHQAKPCIEIYKDDNEMLCLVKLAEENLPIQLKHVAGELQELLSSFSKEELNKIPFEGSWTAAQVGEHIRKSTKAMIQLITGSTKPTERNVEQFVEQISNDFLDFSTKLKAPDFIIPESKQYEKERLLNSLSDLFDKTVALSRSLDLKETCTAFPFPGYGMLTRLEVFHFIVCHTRRHIHQLQTIKATMTKKEVIT